MEIYLDRRAVRHIRSAARDAIDEGDNEALAERMLEAFGDEDVRLIEKRLDGGELYDILSAMIDDWSGDDVDEIFELLEAQLAEVGIDLGTEYRGEVDDTEVLEDEDEFPAVAVVQDDDEDEDEEDEDLEVEEDEEV